MKTLLYGNIGIVKFTKNKKNKIWICLGKKINVENIKLSVFFPFSLNVDGTTA